MTRVDSRAPVAGSSPFVRLRIGASPGSRETTSTEHATRDGDDDELRVRDRSVVDRRRGDARELRLLRIARVPAGSVDDVDLLGITRCERDVVPVVAQQAGDRRPPRARPDDDDLHWDVTKSMETGTPSRPKRARSSFSTQYP